MVKKMVSYRIKNYLEALREMWRRQYRAEQIPEEAKYLQAFKPQNSECTILNNAPWFSTKALHFGTFPFSPVCSLNLKLQLNYILYTDSDISLQRTQGLCIIRQISYCLIWQDLLFMLLIIQIIKSHWEEKYFLVKKTEGKSDSWS